jgi:hypothetical protein
MKICPVGAKLFHADGWTGRHVTKLIVTFHDLVNAPKIWCPPTHKNYTKWESVTSEQLLMNGYYTYEAEVKCAL